MNNMFKGLDLTPTLDNKFILNKKFRYKDIEVPKGFVTNGADSPRPLWFILPPFKPKFLPAVVLHDYLIKKAYNNGLRTEDVEYANKIFEEVLLGIEDSVVTRNAVRLVRLYWKLV